MCFGEIASLSYIGGWPGLRTTRGRGSKLLLSFAFAQSIRQMTIILLHLANSDLCRLLIKQMLSMKAKDKTKRLSHP